MAVKQLKTSIVFNSSEKIMIYPLSLYLFLNFEPFKLLLKNHAGQQRSETLRRKTDCI